MPDTKSMLEHVHYVLLLERGSEVKDRSSMHVVFVCVFVFF